MSEEDLARYAEAILGPCLDIGPGHVVVISGEPAHRALAAALAEGAYRRGARSVSVCLDDPLIERARLTYVDEEELDGLPRWAVEQEESALGPSGSLIAIFGAEAPGLLGDVPPERAARARRGRMAALRRLYRATREDRLRFCCVAWPSAGWASAVYPELDPHEALVRLGAELLRFCRLGPDDAADGSDWERHVAALERRTQQLDALELRALEYRGPGTSLDVRLAEDTCWLSAARENGFGQRVCVNFPSEEVFTSPDPAGTEGTFACSRPLLYAGRRLDGLRGEFRRGRLVRLEADRDADRDMLAAALDVDRGGRRLGEIALVDNRSRIGQAGRTYLETLLDENAAAHIAFGYGFSGARRPGETRRGSRVNASRIHLDVMIGCDDLEITGVTRAGRRVPLLAGGELQL